MAPKRKIVSKECQGLKCGTWDVTAWCLDGPSGKGVGTDPYAWFQKLKKWFKSGTWQLEKSPTSGLEHFQGRFNSYKRMRADSKERLEIALDIGATYCQPTANPNMQNSNYQQKEYTKVAGPWSMSDPPKVMTGDVQWVMDNLDKLTWVRTLADELKSPDPRKILWIFDPAGNAGKSAAQAYFEYHGMMERLPFVTNGKDLLQFVYGFPDKRAYGVNIARGSAPRSERQREEFTQFISGVESLKDGFVFECRNFPRKTTMERPHVVVFANCKPIFDTATRSRWQIFAITNQLELQDITEEILEEHDAFMEKLRIEKDRKTAMKAAVADKAWETAVAKDPEVLEAYKALRESRKRKAAEMEEATQARTKCLRESKQVGNSRKDEFYKEKPDRAPTEGYAWIHTIEGWVEDKQEDLSAASSGSKFVFE